MSKIEIVLGCLFGDESKGSNVNHRASLAKNPLVIRFSGGHQVGHTVVVDGKRHVFSNFGSGTFVGAPTYWSEYCTVDPVGIFKEGNALREMNVIPELNIDSNAMITTPFDIVHNRNLDKQNGHGSVGVGFGATIQRNEDHFHLYARDLLYPKIRDEKIRLLINSYYKYNFNPKINDVHKTSTKLYDEFIAACDDLVRRYKIRSFNDSYFDFMNLIFEGSQGIMLDMDYGFFPHVTRSNTTSKNVMEFIEKYKIPVSDINIYYITRAYQTRHGNGYMSNEDLNTDYITNNPLETNVLGFQGEFRKTVLDLDLLKYAIECDSYHHTMKVNKNMVITCLDQVPKNIPVTINNKLEYVTYDEIGDLCGISNVFPQYSDTGL